MHRHAGTGQVLPHRALPVGGQVDQRRRALQRLVPVIELLLQAFTRQPSTLPQGVIGVPQGQCGQWVLPALTQCGVEQVQLLGHHAQGPAIGHDMVHGHGQYMMLLPQAQHMRLHQGPAGQVEGGSGKRLKPGGQSGGRHCLALQPASLRHGANDHFGAVSHGLELAAQHRVALQQAQQGCFQRIHIQLTAQA
ncbi:putative non-ribosomal peptide synthetase module [Pseudomonas putida S610]|nr:putative non-ribosomal peptide synthetase module [Pseudomonas putida S610]